MGSTLNLYLTNELRAFVDGQSGDGTLYATPSEFVRDLIRKHKQQMEAERLRAGVIEGFQDAAEGRVHQFKGSVRELMKKKRGSWPRREKQKSFLLIERSWIFRRLNPTRLENGAMLKQQSISMHSIGSLVWSSQKPAAIACWITSRVMCGGVTIDRDSDTTGGSAIEA